MQVLLAVSTIATVRGEHQFPLPGSQLLAEAAFWYIPLNCLPLWFGRVLGAVAGS